MILDFIKENHLILLFICSFIFYEFRLYHYTNKRDINSSKMIIKFDTAYNKRVKDLRALSNKKFNEYSDVLTNVYTILNKHKTFMKALDKNIKENSMCIENIESKLYDADRKLDNIHNKMDEINFLLTSLKAKIKN